MSVQVLAVTMNDKDHSLVKKMNIDSDAIIGNQCNDNSIETFKDKENTITYLNFNEKGVGLNRNNVLMRATADICILADDDMVFFEGYQEKVEKLFKDNPKADMLIFNIDTLKDEGVVRNKGLKRVGLLDYGVYGAARIAFRREKIAYKGIYFNENFGGGSKHTCGEDTLFLRECLKKKVKIYTVPDKIAYLNNDRDSSWFTGYNRKYFYDKGVFLAIAHPYLARVFGIYLAYAHKEWHTELKGKEARKEIFKGIKYIKSL